MKSKTKVSSLAILTSLLVACGGSGGSSTPTPTPVPQNSAPVSVIKTTQAQAQVFDNVNLSGLSSTDVDGDTLHFQWSIKSKPNQSNVTVSDVQNGTLQFIPDVIGQYVIELTVSDGKASNTSQSTIQVSNTYNIQEIGFRPSVADYSASLDKIVVVDDSSKTLNIIDRKTGIKQKIQLSAEAEVLKLSPNGKLAIIIHPNHISYIDLEKAQLITAYSNEGPFTDGFVTDDAIAYFIGQKNGQWNAKPLVKINLVTGQQETQLQNTFAKFYSESKGIYANKKNQIFYRNFGSSNQDIYSIIIDPKTANAVSVADSPYFGGYPVGDTFFLDNNQDYVYTSIGTYFYTKNLNYGGKIQLSENEKIIALNQDQAQNTSIILNILSADIPSIFDQNALKLHNFYTQYSGFGFGTTVVKTFPQISANPSYGLKLFISNENQNVGLVQIGSATLNTANLKYYIVTMPAS